VSYFVGIVIAIGMEESILKLVTSVIYFILCHDAYQDVYRSEEWDRCLKKYSDYLQFCECAFILMLQTTLLVWNIRFRLKNRKA
jgi:hypothetical protein